MQIVVSGNLVCLVEKIGKKESEASTENDNKNVVSSTSRDKHKENPFVPPTSEGKTLGIEDFDPGLALEKRLAKRNYGSNQDCRESAASSLLPLKAKKPVEDKPPPPKKSKSSIFTESGDEDEEDKKLI